MNKEYIINLIDEINKIELGSIVAITREYNEGTCKYIVEYEEEYEEIELISLEEKNTIWGVNGKTIEEVRIDLLCDGIRGDYDKISVLTLGEVVV